jgi:MOSC domain-containing protein YiiM
MQGTIISLFSKPESGKPMQPAHSLDLVAGKGIKGDAAYGRTRRQVLFVDQAILEDFALLPGDLRENITVAGIDLRHVTASSVVTIGQASLLVQGECTPCSKMDEIRPGLMDAIREQRGILASVLRDGTIHVGEKVEISSA